MDSEAEQPRPREGPSRSQYPNQMNTFVDGASDNGVTTEHELLAGNMKERFQSRSRGSGKELRYIIPIQSCFLSQDR